ncbi:MAG: hypothetical protein MHM6MM_003464 [Cercozoa sp. M6MM]
MEDYVSLDDHPLHTSAESADPVLAGTSLIPRTGENSGAPLSQDAQTVSGRRRQRQRRNNDFARFGDLPQSNALDEEFDEDVRNESESEEDESLLSGDGTLRRRRKLENYREEVQFREAAAAAANSDDVRQIVRNYIPTTLRRTVQDDERIRRLNLQNALLGLASVVLSVIINETFFDRDTGRFELKAAGSVLKLIVTALTFVLMWRLYVYFRLVARQDGFISIRHSPLFWQMLLEIAVCSLHPIVFIDYLEESLGMDIWGEKGTVFVFLRLYLWIRVYRDHSDLFIYRHDIAQNIHLESHTAFDSGLALKIFYHLRPFTVVSVSMLASTILFAYTIYICERQEQPQAFTFTKSVYFTIITFTSVGYGGQEPVTSSGLFVGAMQSLFGMLVTASFVGAWLSALSLSPTQRKIADYVAAQKLNEEIEACFANLEGIARRQWTQEVAELNEGTYVPPGGTLASAAPVSANRATATTRGNSCWHRFRRRYTRQHNSAAEQIRTIEKLRTLLHVEQRTVDLFTIQQQMQSLRTDMLEELRQVHRQLSGGGDADDAPADRVVVNSPFSNAMSSPAFLARSHLRDDGRTRFVPLSNLSLRSTSSNDR